MTRKPHYTQAAKDTAIAWAQAGKTTREIADDLAALGTKVSHVSVSRWLKAASGPTSPAVDPALAERLRARNAAPAAEPAPTTPADDGADELDFEAELRGLIDEARSEAKALEQASNPKLAQASQGRVVKLMGMLAQVTKRRPSDPDVLTASHAQIEKAFGELSAGFIELCETRGILCGACNKELSCAFGRGELTADSPPEARVAYLKTKAQQVGR
ncbi:MAG: hypothetical protein ABUL60_29740 [Myxococcales bacterium]